MNKNEKESGFGDKPSYVARETSYEIASEIASLAKRALHLPAHEVEMLEHDINNLRSNEWVDVFMQLSDKSKANKLFFQHAVEVEENVEAKAEGRMKAVNIDWDVDSPEETDQLPLAIEIPEGMTDEDEISDYLSEVTGFCHKGFDLVAEMQMLNKADVLKEILQLAKDELDKPGEFGYTMPDGKHHIYVSVDDIGSHLSGHEYIYRIEPNRLDEDGCAEPMGNVYTADFGDYAELLLGCVWCMEQFEADREQQRTQNEPSRIEVDLGYATLVAETGYDQNYKEITVGLEGKDGVWLQDLAMIGGKYHYDEKAADPSLEVVQDKGVSVKVWTDKDYDDYTHDFSVDIYESEEILGMDDIEEEYETDERYFVYDADDDPKGNGFKYEDDAIDWAKEHNLPTVKVHKYFYDERGKIRPDGDPEVIWTDAVEVPKQTLDEKIQSAASKVVADVKENASKAIELE